MYLPKKQNPILVQAKLGLPNTEVVESQEVLGPAGISSHREVPAKRPRPDDEDTPAPKCRGMARSLRQRGPKGAQKEQVVAIPVGRIVASGKGWVEIEMMMLKVVSTQFKVLSLVLPSRPLYHAYCYGPVSI
ncbi:hypothetical protein C8F04DRAFT_1182007 [Mycena alexandri]|uniref:Uncharacterized protein n=1 Tax=Mycena alexandri TaxID=1745969 RepID=A0AAD6SX98_9AGAR|nr:hypothetical protein C8F04DRAFT_1182007 [Mycena alexandri]